MPPLSAIRDMDEGIIKYSNEERSEVRKPLVSNFDCSVETNKSINLFSKICDNEFLRFQKSHPISMDSQLQIDLIRSLFAVEPNVLKQLNPEDHSCVLNVHDMKGDKVYI